MKLTFARSTLLTTALFLALGAGGAQTTPPATPAPPTTPAPPPTETPPADPATPAPPETQETPAPSTADATLPEQTTFTLGSGSLTLPYLSGATPVRSVDTVSGVAVLYRGAVTDAFERYAEALTSAGFTVVSTQSIPFAVPSATTDDPGDGEATTDTAATATTGAAPATPPAATAPETPAAPTTPASPAGDTAGTGSTDTATPPATDTAGDETTAAAQPSGRVRQVMILERNGEQVRLTVYQAYGLTTVLLARV